MIQAEWKAQVDDVAAANGEKITKNLDIANKKYDATDFNTVLNSNASSYS